MAREIRSKQIDQTTKMLNNRQREILAAHYGSMSAANDHVNQIDALIPLALKRAKEIDLDTIEIHDWQRVSKDGEDFSPDRRSIAFHREMNRLKREREVM